jgi:competence protein ComEC
MAAWRSLVSVLVCVALWTGTAGAATTSGDLKVYVLNVGQGDAILIVCPHGTHRMLIDSGARGYPGSQVAFKAQIQALIPGPKPILNVVISTHPHEDHIGGLEWVLSTFRVKTFVDSGRPYTSSFAGIARSVKAQVSAGSLNAFKANQFPPSRVADFCPATNLTAELLVPKGYGRASNQNNNSVVVLITYGKQKLLFTGDAERAEEKLLLDDPALSKRVANVAFYKVGHHGAETSTTSDFLTVINPQMAGVSSGCKNIAKNKGYRHPRAAVLTALDDVVPGDGKDLRSLQAGKTAKGQWSKTEIHQGVYATSSDDTFMIVTDGTKIAKRAATVKGAMGSCQP